MPNMERPGQDVPPWRWPPNRRFTREIKRGRHRHSLSDTAHGRGGSRQGTVCSSGAANAVEKSGSVMQAVLGPCPALPAAFRPYIPAGLDAVYRDNVQSYLPV